VRTNGPSANDILALFDRLGDPFAGGAQTKPGSAKPEDANNNNDPTAQQKQPVPGDGNAKLGFDQEDRSSLLQKAPPPKDAKNASSDQQQQQQQQKPKDAPKDAPKDNLLSQLGKQLQEGLQKSFGGVFAKLANLGKNAEAAEPEVPKDSANAKEAKQNSRGAGASGAASGSAAAELAHQDPTNFASHTTEGAPNPAAPSKTQEKAEAHVEQFREELRSMGNDPARGGEAKKLDKPRDGKEAPELMHAEGARESPELRELVGGWKPESCNLEEDERRANALRIEDALGPQMRCRGVLEDGSRCIRKPVMGIPYCREHASAVYAATSDAGFVTIGAGVEPTSGAPEVTEPEAVAYVDGASESSEEVADPTLPDQPAYGNVVTD
jgi:hypothetical protein